MLEEKYILFEDNHLLIAHKQAGIPTQSDDTGDTSMADLVEQYIRVRYEKPGAVYLGVIHRLDRPVSGLILFAKTSKAAARMSEMFRERKVEKVYLALVAKEPPQWEGQLKHYIWKDQNANRSYCNTKETPGSKLAILDYKVIQTVNKIWLLEVRPQTGRPHQIRAQLSTVGCPIVGDMKYGSNVQVEDRSVCLVARRLSFEHPVKKMPIEVISLKPQGTFWQKFDLTRL